MKNSKLIAPTLCALIALALLAYTIARAWLVPFTHDEALSYNCYMGESFMNIVSYNVAHISANNHILNTLAMKLFSSIFGISEFTLRIQSIIAHAVFLVVSFLLVYDKRNALMTVCGYMLINVNQFLLDFFSLARGYAVAAALMMISIYCLIRFIKLYRLNYLAAGILAAFFAVSANFALLNYLLAYIFIIESYALYSHYLSRNRMSKLAGISCINIAGFGSALALCYEPVRHLLEKNELYFGGSDGFWHDTVTSLIETYGYGQTYTPELIILLKTATAIVAAGLPVLLWFRYRRSAFSGWETAAAIVISILWLIVFSCEAQHFLFGAHFLEDRFALFLVPVFTLAFIYMMSIAGAGNSMRLRIVTSSLLVVFTAASVFHFLKVKNLAYAFNWKYDASSRQMLADLGTKIPPGKKIKLGIEWYYEPVINFYRTTKKLDWLQPVDRSGISGIFDYYYIDNLKEVKLPAKLLSEYKLTDSYLLERIE